MSADQPPLDLFVDRLPVVLARLRDVELPDHFPFDLTPASVAELDRSTAGQGEDGADVVALAAYLGEVLLRVGGGGWRWDERDGPVVELDPGLGLDAVPVVRAVREHLGAGRPLRGVVEPVEQAVAQRRRDEPDWRPRAEQRPAVGDLRVEDLPQPAWLAGWLAERSAAFAGWAEQHRGSWDFSTASLDALETLLLEHLGSPEAVSAAARTPLVDGAVWYLGEVLCRTRDARWHYFEPDPANPPNAFVGRPHVTQDRPDGASVVPLGLLRAAVRARRPGELRRRAEAFGGG
ncbi:hypothetical protein DT076_10335 [Desertihabitans brevis]|uniref:Uncharacterized protein n=1 Tax=Desertihabitans brevis TaxID=2268447 RepID=A0A367YTW7_9ACTN|nr:hypothetical protein [Desertihabitans brevis]RCK69294.1 hypothetical protein DT076_10335 [Desertihabitans brevis]